MYPKFTPTDYSQMMCDGFVRTAVLFQSLLSHSEIEMELWMKSVFSHGRENEKEGGKVSTGLKINPFN